MLKAARLPTRKLSIRKLAEVVLLQADSDGVRITQADFDGLYEDELQIASREALRRLEELETHLFGWIAASAS